MFQRFTEEHGFGGQYTIVKNYVCQRRTSAGEMFVPLIHPPGRGQADLGEAQVIISGPLCKARYLLVDLPYTDAYCVKAYPVEITESSCGGHNWAFSFFVGASPQSMLYDSPQAGDGPDSGRREAKAYPGIRRGGFRLPVRHLIRPPR